MLSWGLGSAKKMEMSEKRPGNDLTTNKLGRLAAPLLFVMLMAAVCLLVSGSPLRAAPDHSLFGQTTLTVTSVLTPTATLGPGRRVHIPRIDKGGGWSTRIQVLNVGGARTGVISLFWGNHSGQCEDIGLESGENCCENKKNPAS